MVLEPLQHPLQHVLDILLVDARLRDVVLDLALVQDDFHDLIVVYVHEFCDQLVSVRLVDLPALQLDLEQFTLLLVAARDSQALLLLSRDGLQLGFKPTKHERVECLHIPGVFVDDSRLKHHVGVVDDLVDEVLGWSADEFEDEVERVLRVFALEKRLLLDHLHYAAAERPDVDRVVLVLETEPGPAARTRSTACLCKARSKHDEGVHIVLLYESTH